MRSTLPLHNHGLLSSCMCGMLRPLRSGLISQRTYVGEVQQSGFRVSRYFSYILPCSSSMLLGNGLCMCVNCVIHYYIT